MLTKSKTKLVKKLNKSNVRTNWESDIFLKFVY